METPISMHHILFTLQGWLTLDVVSSLCEVNVLLKASLKWPSCPSGAMLWGRVGGSGWVVGARCWVAQLPASAGEHWGGGGGGGEGEEDNIQVSGGGSMPPLGRLFSRQSTIGGDFVACLDFASNHKMMAECWGRFSFENSLSHVKCDKTYIAATFSPGCCQPTLEWLQDFWCSTYCGYLAH